MNQPDRPPLDDLVAELETIEGVERAYVDAGRRTLVVVCGGAAVERGPVEALARAAVAGAAAAADHAVEICFRSPPEPNRRVRLVSAAQHQAGRADAHIVVSLEWQTRHFDARAAVQGGSVGVVRAAGEATLRALEAVVAERVRFQLTAAKTTRVYDEEIVLVLVHSPAAPGRALVGVAAVAGSVEAAAARAALSACNRLLGNYLETA